MKHTFLGLVVAVGLLAVGPVAGASADISFQGNCSVTGKAHFSLGLKGQPQTESYDFASGPPGKNTQTGNNDPDTTNCKGVTINGKAVPEADGPAVVKVHADNQTLSCAASQGQGGQGVITLANGLAIPFLLDVQGEASEVQLTVRGETSGSASGKASFMNYVGPATAAQDCGPTGNGLNDVGFTASFDNTSGQPLVDPGTYPPVTAPPSGGGQSGGGSGGGSSGGGGAPSGGGSSAPPSNGTPANQTGSGGGTTTHHKKTKKHKSNKHAKKHTKKHTTKKGKKH